MVRLDSWKCLLKKDIFELGSEVRGGGAIPQTGRPWIPDSWSNETDRTVPNRVEIAFWDFQKFPPPIPTTTPDLQIGQDTKPELW